MIRNVCLSENYFILVIFLLQEHCQHKPTLNILSCIDSNAVYMYCGSSAMDESVFLSCRPYGGTARISASNVVYDVTLINISLLDYQLSM